LGFLLKTRNAKSHGRCLPFEGGKIITFRATAAHFRGLLRNCKRIAMKLHELWTLDMLKRHKYSAKVHRCTFAVRLRLGNDVRFRAPRPSQ
jgi:hypothetical protein